MKYRLYIYIILISIIQGCTYQPPKESTWIKTKNDYYIFAIENEYSYEWNGEHFERYIIGSGDLNVFIGDSLIKTLSLKNILFGAIDNDDVFEINKDRYIGKLKDGLFSGNGVLIKENEEIYIGEFNNGKPNGLLNYYRNGKLRYSGHWKFGVYNGTGIQYHQNGQTNDGIWINGVISGKTKIHYNNGEYYGYLLNGKPNEQGVISFLNGSKYDGNWKNGYFSGQGTFIDKKKDTIFGEWDNGLLNGYAEIISKNSYFSGAFEQGKLNGNGYYVYSDSSVYSGHFSNNKKEGYGDFLFNNKDLYQGEWKEDRFDGIGFYSYNNGDFYIGDWQDGIQNGTGTIETRLYKYTGDISSGVVSGYGEIDYKKEGDIYKGNFSQNIKSSLGTYFYKNGNKYEGEFQNDLFNGIGIFTYEDGSRYQGEFYNGKIYGEGSLYLKEGDSSLVITAIWNDEGKFPEEASILFPNGDLYEGTLKNGFPTDKGIWSTQKEREQNTVFNQSEESLSHRANEFYKKHQESINIFGDILGYIEIGAIVVTEIAILAAPITGGKSLVVAAISGGVAFGAKAGYASIQSLNALSSGIDAKEYYEEGDTAMAKKAAMKSAGYTTLAVISLGAPGVAGKTMSKTSRFITPVIKKTFKPLLIYNKTYGKRFIVKILQNGKVQKIVRTAKRFRMSISKQTLNAKESIRILKDKNNILKQLLAEPKSGSVLSQNMNAVGKKYIKGTQAHHIIGNDSRCASSVLLKQLLKTNKIDINNAINGMRLPGGHKDNGVKAYKTTTAKGQIHKGSHNCKYYDAVYEIMKNAKNQQQFIELLSKVKKEIYSGKISLNRINLKNTTFNTVRTK
ncbi:hypothetical protein P700755_003949 [Psychroflexus torquis ATCC 700755]|uniref:MORN repeat protein n=1 Tax=Psychroflexus torquis (strain ATCC 700755 / CIP 106069 / ACAM 623) TaxID=313595 RepID=K4IYI2_PSYTT|nr:AHH domain-containing protein [Psychroflexus torquis]AFU70520.1 hypothetical protein P700755_003949 [Psychroflexus torquis ATCC 700755]